MAWVLTFNKKIMRKKLKILLIILPLIITIIIFSCEKDTPVIPQEDINKIAITDLTSGNVSYRSATVSSQISETYGIKIEQHGHCWSTDINSEITDNKTELGTFSSGTFTSNLTGLEPNTTYYIRAYIIFNDIVYYSDNNINFSTVAIGFPVVSTKEVTNITAFTTECGGEITENNGGDVTARGVCWSNKSLPTIEHEDSITTDDAGMGEFTSIIDSLEYGTKYYVRAYATNDAGTSYGNEILFRTDTSATIITLDISDTTAISATVGGNITNDGDASITSRGICYNNTGIPTINDSVSYSGNGTGSFTINLESLYIDSTYYVRAFAINEAGVSYGEEKSFETKDGIPVITTTAITNITATSAQSGGEITNDGGLTVLKRGLCWSKNHNPTISDLHKYSASGGMGSFSVSTTDLDINTPYYVRAFAINAIDTTYGDEKPFETKDGIPVITTTAITNITAISAQSGGSISDDGGLPVLARGLCWNITGNPTLNDSITVNASGSGSFASNMENLIIDTTYYVKAYAINDLDTTYGNELSFTTKDGIPTITTTEVTNITAISAESGGNIIDNGGFPILNKGLCWSISLNPTLADNKDFYGSGDESFNGPITGLEINTQYYVRAFAINTIDTIYADTLAFKTTTGLPIVVTIAATNITTSSADCGGNVTSDGGFSITERGICWSTTNQNPTTSDNKVPAANSGIGTYSVPLSGLLPNTYYYTAYAINSAGTSYGEADSFEIFGVPLINEVVDTDVHDDDGGGGVGNGDSKINVGEEIDLEVEIKNNGNATAYNIVGTLELIYSDDMSVCNITDSEETIASLAVGASIELDDFDFDVTGMPSDSELDFKLTITYDDSNGNNYEEIIENGEMDIPVYSEVFTTTLNPSNDAYVSTSSGDSNYNTTNLIVESQSYVRYSYISFSSLPTYSTLDKANLRIYCSSTGQNNLSVTVYLAAGSWSESTITFNNQPAYVSSFNTNFTVTSSGQYFEINIKNFVEEWVSNGNYGLVLVVNDSQVVFNSSEDSSNKPELYLEYQE